MKSKFVSSLIVVLCMINSSMCYAEVTPPKVCAKGAVLIEKDSGRVLYEKDAHESLSMASTTKIMTCILAIESGNLDDIVTISKRASQAPPVKLHLKQGEKQRLGDLLYALMLQSDNDAAVAIAEHIGGSVEDFCEQMTLKAKSIGANDTTFKTPNGLDAQGHCSTAYDMGIIGAYAISNPEFVKIVTTPDIQIPTIPVEGSRTYGLQNKNRFFYGYNGANGMKTGFTNKAGHCFVGSAVRGDMQLVGVALGSGWGNKGKTQKYTDVSNMMDYGFKNYKKYKVLSPTKDIASIRVVKGIEDSVKIDCNLEIILPLTEEEKENTVIEYVYPEEIVAPIYKNAEIGKVQIICKGELLEEAPITISEDVPKATIIHHIKKFLHVD